MSETPEEINQRAARGLVRARTALSIHSRAQFARMLRDLSGSGPDDSTYGSWETGEHRVPLWGAVLASRLSGLSLDEILEQPVHPKFVQLEEELRGVQAALKRLIGEQEEAAKKTETA